MKNNYSQSIAGMLAKARLPLSLLGLSACVLSASAQSNEDETVFELSPFEIDASKDQGYRAESTLAGSRLNSSLRDTPASIQVYTKEFLEDIGAVNLQDVLNYSANVENGAGDEEAFFGGNFAERGFVNFQARVRGLPSSRARDYFAWQLPMDTYLTERLDESRGPNALLFGIAAAGGIQNQSTKKASTASAFNRLVFRTDSEGLIRGEIDVNRVLIEDKLAIRINALHADGDGWQSNTFNRKNAIHGGLTFRPDDKTLIRMGYESFSQDDSVGNSFVETDTIANWINNGSQTFDLFSDNRIDQAGANGAVSAPNRDTVLRTAGVTNGGTAPQVALIEGGDPSFDGTAVSRYRSLLSQNYVDSNGDGRLNQTFNVARTGEIYPYGVRFNGPGNQRSLDASDFVATVQRELIEDLYVQVDYAKYSYFWDTNPTSGSLRGDANAYWAGPDRTPATAVQNPNAGEAFIFQGNLTRWQTDREQETQRLTGTYSFDFAEKGDGALSKLGSHRIAAGFEHVNYKSDQPVIRLRWFDAQTGMGAYHPVGPNAQNQAQSMKYIDLDDPSTWTGVSLDMVGVPVTDPLDPSRQIVAEWVSAFESPWHVDQSIDAMMVSTQSFFFDRKLVVTAGYREDEGTNKKFLYELDDLQREYIPIGRDAFNSADWDVENFTAGAVFHVNDKFSLFYNQATNSNIPDAESVTIGSLENPGQVSFPGGGEGEDFGVMARLFGDKVDVRLTRYQSREDNALIGAGAAGNIDNFHDHIIEWWHEIGFGLADDPPAPRVFDDRVNRYTLSKASEGYEVQVTSNFNRNWRGTFNYSYTGKDQTNVGIVENQWFVDTIEWATRTVETWDTSTITQEWIDAGIVPTNDITEFEVENGSILADRIETANNWRANNMVPGPPFGLRRNKFNFFTNYTFHEGPMKGFSFGGGYRYQGPNMMHWETDSSGNLSRIKGESTGYTDGMLRYRTSMQLAGKDIKVSYQLNIQNLFDIDDPTIARYLRNDRSNPADRLYYVQPRSFRFSATFDF